MRYSVSCGVDMETNGERASRLTVTEAEALPPSLAAVHVYVVPSLSVLNQLCAQPASGTTLVGESSSRTSQLMLTSLVYQPSFPREPSTQGDTCGGVESTYR